MRVSNVVRGLSDSELLCSLDRVMQRSRGTTAELLAHLGEVEARRLYLRASCGSMFKYCMERLGLDEGAAYMRITAARQARRFPVILEMVADGRLHLAGVCLLAKHLTHENHEELLGAVTGKSKRKIERILADREPKPDTPPRVRKLPNPPRPDGRQEPLALAPAPLAASPQQPEPEPEPEPVPTPRAEPTPEQAPAASTTEPSQTASKPERSLAASTPKTSPTAWTTEPAQAASTTEPTQAPSTTEPTPVASTIEPSPATSTVEPSRAKSTTVPSPAPSTVEPSRAASTTELSPAASRAEASRAVASPEPSPAAAAPSSRRDRSIVSPLGQRRHRVELTASDSLVDKLDRARALLSHTLPGCDIADVIEQAVTMLVERLETKRFGARRTKKATTPAATTDPMPADPVAFGAAFIDRRIDRRREAQRVGRPDDGPWWGGSAGAT